MRNCVPASWEVAKIGQLVDRLQYGYTAKAESGRPGPRFLRITDIENGRINWSSVPGCRISEDDLAKYELGDGDVVFARTGSIEKACVVVQPPEAVFASYLIRGKPLLRDLSAWLHHFLQSLSYRQQALEGSAGIGRANINAKSIGEIELPVAPLPEQHRIVEAIESYLTRLDDAVASLERVQRNLERYRASILKAAVEGRLVPTEAELARREGRSYEPASELLERILAERKTRWIEDAAEKAQAKGNAKALLEARKKAEKKYKEPVPPDTSDLPDLPEGWCWATMEQLLSESLINGRSVPTAEEGFDVLRLTALADGRIDLRERKTGAWTAEDALPFLVIQGDIFLARGNGSIRLVGVAGLVEESPIPVAFPDTMIRVRLLEDSLLPRLFVTLWNSRILRNLLEPRAKTTAGIHKVNQKDISTMPVPLAPLVEQRRLFEAIDRNMSTASTVIRGTNLARARATSLRQSILKWAFEGKLVEQDLDDEPASALLGRIKAERSGTRR